MVPMVIAKDINKRLLVHFRALMTRNADLRLGTIILDFADEAIIKQIFLLNFSSINDNIDDDKASIKSRQL